MKKLLIVIMIAFVAIFALDKLKQNGDLKKFITLPNLFQQSKTSSVSLLPTIKPMQLSGTEEEKRIQMIEKALPSVVTIGINFTTKQPDRLQLSPLDIFGNGSGFQRVPGKEKTIDRNIGSGFIVSAEGLIISNKHVVEQEDAKYKVRLNNGDTLEVDKIYRDPLNDLAILKVMPKSSLPALSLGNSDKLKLGQTVVAVGTPLGEFTNSVTSGIVSGLGRGITAGSPLEGTAEKLDGVIQTDAAISAGNSGGPLLNSSGEVIGVNTAVSGEGQNIGFALPVNIVKTLLSEFDKRGGTFERPYMGVKYQMIDRQTAIANKLVEGAYVQDVVSGSPAEKAGIEPDDVITKIDGEKVSGTDEQSVVKVLLSKAVGQTISVTYWRAEQEKTVYVSLEAFK
ncbi:MAG: trypsin-like peptidase domain-containing protein [Candidatus Roizmanbacteria bacterium]